MSVAVGQFPPDPHRARHSTSHIPFSTWSERRRTAVALLTMLILAISVIMGVSALRQMPPTAELPQPSGNAQPGPVPNR